MIVGIIGAGTMGSGIAHAFAQCEGFEVRLCDITGDIAARGKGRIENQLKKRVLKGKMDEADARAILEQGITTFVGGMCGESPAPISAEHEEDARWES